MAEYTPETNEWLGRAQQAERPFDRVYDSGTLILSLVRDSHRIITANVHGAGYACWRAVDQIRGRRLRLRAKPQWSRILFDPGEPGVRDNSVRLTLDIPEPDMDAPHLVDVDHSCRFSVVHPGEEELRTERADVKRPLTSRFFADSGNSRPLSEPSSSGATLTPDLGAVVESKGRHDLAGC